jgi:hypothetical protein
VCGVGLEAYHCEEGFFRRHMSSELGVVIHKRLGLFFCRVCDVYRYPSSSCRSLLMNTSSDEKSRSASASTLADTHDHTNVSRRFNCI